jgi:hypothetical protein
MNKSTTTAAATIDATASATKRSWKEFGTSLRARLPKLSMPTISAPSTQTSVGLGMLALAIIVAGASYASVQAYNGSLSRADAYQEQIVAATVSTQDQILKAARERLAEKPTMLQKVYGATVTPVVNFDRGTAARMGLTSNAGIGE